MSCGCSALVVGRLPPAAGGAAGAGTAVTVPGGRGAAGAGAAARGWRESASTLLFSSSSWPESVVSDDALRQRGQTPLGFPVPVALATLRLCQRGLRLAERPLGALLRDRHVRPELEEILLGGDAGDVLDRRAAAEQQGGEEKGAPSPRHGIRGYRGLARKCARRFLAQHASLCSVHCGRSSP